MDEEMQLQVKDWYIEGRTYQQISDLLCELGHKVSRSQVHRWVSRKRNELERIEIAKQKASMLAKYLVPEGGEVETAAVGLAQAIALEALMDARPVQVGSIEDLAKVSHSIGRLQASAVTRERWEHDKRKRIQEAVAVLKEDVKRLLDGMPELTGQLLDVVYAAEERMLEKTG